MKIVCTQENLKNGLSVAGRIVSNANTLPILNNLLVKTESGMLKISSTNLEMAVVTRVRCRVESEGEVTVVGKTFSELINNMPNSNITLENKGGELLVEAENYHTKIKTLPVEEFPLIPTIEDGGILNLEAQELKNAVDSVSFATSTNQTQPEISGVFLAKEGKSLRLAATDRYRLAEKKLLTNDDSGSQEVIIPQKTVNELSRIIGNQKGNVELVFSETQLAVNFNDTQLISRLVDGQYPAYREIIPTEFITTITTQKQPLINALKAAAVFSQGSNSIKVDFNQKNQQMVITSESADLGKSSVELPGKIFGSDVSLILNFHYLLEGLGSIEGENVLIKVIDDNSPSLIVPEGKTDFIYLVMPIKS